ncbi:hypothetical protein [Candidatus Poriferisodalis sp.]|uniref:hypothetical protein n=1 Tax=Candidatus Poriferisodalis sp. TaxID=3101277 RepID=UPI003B5AF637
MTHVLNDERKPWTVQSSPLVVADARHRRQHSLDALACRVGGNVLVQRQFGTVDRSSLGTNPGGSLAGVIEADRGVGADSDLATLAVDVDPSDPRAAA